VVASYLILRRRGQTGYFKGLIIILRKDDGLSLISKTGLKTMIRSRENPYLRGILSTHLYEEAAWGMEWIDDSIMISNEHMEVTTPPAVKRRGYCLEI
jgi:hypothetical protein